MTLGLSLLASRTSENVSVFSPASPSAQATRDMFLLVLAVAAGIFLIVEGVLIYSLLRFRRKQGQVGEPPQVYGSQPIEIAWTVFPALIVFVLFLIVIRTEYQVRVPPPEPAAGDNALFVTVI